MISFGGLKLYSHNIKNRVFDIFKFRTELDEDIEEDVVQEPAFGLRKVCQFLGVDSSFEFQNKNKKIGEGSNSKILLTLRYYLPFMSPLICRVDKFLPVTKRRPSVPVIYELYKIYEEENENLFDLLGRRIVSWKNP